MGNYDFSGWATKNGLRCADGRTIMRDAFRDNDGKTVPLVWNHRHDKPDNVLGHALLENRPEGVYAYCRLNDTEQGRNAKQLILHGDVNALSICANQLKQQGGNVLHGVIREVSLVLAGANPGAFIDTILKHSGDNEEEYAEIYTGEELEIFHADIQNKNNETEEKGMAENKAATEKEETVKDVFDTFTEKQKTVVYALMAKLMSDNGAADDDEEEEETKMKHNIFDSGTDNTDVLTHADQSEIIGMAKSNSVGSLRTAIEIFEENSGGEIMHGFDDIDVLFPDYKDVRPGAPELVTRDQSWVGVVMQKTHKSPFARIRTKQVDIRDSGLRASGFRKGKKKADAPNVKLLKRTTDPQTIYRKDALSRDDINDIQDFDVVSYQYGIMRQNLNEELATAIMIGDGREEGDEAKIDETHIRSIWNDDELYTIHTDVDVNAVKSELNGENFGTNYIYAEAIISSALYARENYKGSGTPDFFCTPHLLNVMLLARDLNGRRIYNSKTDLAAALNVGNIHTAEQFEGRVRTTKTGDKKKLLGIFVNLADYQLGSVKGGEITKFNQFDIDFNQEKYLIETRVSGALTRVYSAIALEEPVTTATPELGDE